MYTNAKRLNRIVVLVVILFIGSLIAACGSASPAALLEKARGYYHDGVNLETDWSALYGKLEATSSSGMLSILDQNKFANECFTNTKDVVKGALSGLFEEKNADGTPKGVLDTNAMISALAVNNAYPDLTACQNAKLELMRQVQAWRSNTLDLVNENLSRQANYVSFLNNDIIKRTLNDAVAKVGNTLGDIGINYVGFPSDNLTVKIRSQDFCQKVNQFHPGDKMYIAVWDGAYGTCTLKRQAAFDYMTRVIVSGETSNRFNCGIDAGIDEQVNDDCTVSPKGAPTATAVPR